MPFNCASAVSTRTSTRRLGGSASGQGSAMTVAPDISVIDRARVRVKARSGSSAQSCVVFDRTAPSAVCHATSPDEA